MYTNSICVPSRMVLWVTLAVLNFCIAVPYVHAHGSGVSLEATVNERIIDIGYDPVELVTGERVVFDFSLYDLASSTVPFDRVWVRIESNSETVFATGVGKASLGPTTLLVTLPSDLGTEASLHVRYEYDGDEIGSASFTLPVTSPESRFIDTPWVLVVLGVFIGLFMSTLAYFMRKHR